MNNVLIIRLKNVTTKLANIIKEFLFCLLRNLYVTLNTLQNILTVRLLFNSIYTPLFINLTTKSPTTLVCFLDS